MFWEVEGHDGKTCSAKSRCSDRLEDSNDEAEDDVLVPIVVHFV